MSKYMRKYIRKYMRGYMREYMQMSMARICLHACEYLLEVDHCSCRSRMHPSHECVWLIHPAAYTYIIHVHVDGWVLTMLSSSKLLSECTTPTQAKCQA